MKITPILYKILALHYLLKLH